jgi:hypothetical protein
MKMTQEQARRTANVIMFAGAATAVYFVLKDRRLRRLTWQLARGWATGPLVAWSATEIRRAWDESAARQPAPRHAQAHPEPTRGATVRPGVA